MPIAPLGDPCNRLAGVAVSKIERQPRKGLGVEHRRGHELAHPDGGGLTLRDDLVDRRCGAGARGIRRRPEAGGRPRSRRDPRSTRKRPRYVPLAAEYFSKSAWLTTIAGTAHRKTTDLATPVPPPVQRRGPDASRPGSGNHRPTRMERVAGTRFPRSRAWRHRRTAPCAPASRTVGSQPGSTPRSLSRAWPICQLSVRFEPGQLSAGPELACRRLRNQAKRRFLAGPCRHGEQLSARGPHQGEQNRDGEARDAGADRDSSEPRLVLNDERQDGRGNQQQQRHDAFGGTRHRAARHVCSCGPSMRFRIATAIPTLIRSDERHQHAPGHEDEAGEVARHRRQRHDDGEPERLEQQGLQRRRGRSPRWARGRPPSAPLRTGPAPATNVVPSRRTLDASKARGGIGRVIQNASLPTSGCVCTTSGTMTISPSHRVRNSTDRQEAQRRPRAWVGRRERAAPR